MYRQNAVPVLNEFLFSFCFQTLTSVPSPATCANTPALTALENIPVLAQKDMSSREQERVKVLGPCFSLGVKYDCFSNLHAHFRSVSKLDLSAPKEICNGIWALELSSRLSWKECKRSGCTQTRR